MDAKSPGGIIGVCETLQNKQKCSFYSPPHYTASSKVNRKQSPVAHGQRNTENEHTLYANESGKEEDVNLSPALHIKRRNYLSSFSAIYEKVPQT